MSEMENQTIVEDNAAVLDEEFDETTSASEEQQPDPKEHMLAILEGLLFLCGDDGLSIEQAAASMDASEEYVAELFDDLQKYYLQESRGIEIARFGEKYRFLSKEFIHEAASIYPRITLAAPQIFSEPIGLRLCGIALEPFCPLLKCSSASRTSVLCK